MRRKCQMPSNFSGVDFLGTALNLETKEIKFRLALFTCSINVKIRHFHVVVVQQRNVHSKRDTRAKLLFCLTNLLLF